MKVTRVFDENVGLRPRQEDERGELESDVDKKNSWLTIVTVLYGRPFLGWFNCLPAKLIRWACVGKEVTNSR